MREHIKRFADAFNLDIYECEYLCQSGYDDVYETPLGNVKISLMKGWFVSSDFNSWKVDLYIIPSPLERKQYIAVPKGFKPKKEVL